MSPTPFGGFKFSVLLEPTRQLHSGEQWKVLDRGSGVIETVFNKLILTVVCRINQREKETSWEAVGNDPGRK